MKLSNNKVTSKSREPLLGNMATTGLFLTLLVSSFLVSGGWALLSSALEASNSREQKENDAVRVEPVTPKTIN